MANGKKERDPRVEALRLVAAASIAIFHTFMPWFSAMTGGYGTGPGDGIIDNPIAAPLLGFINLLGSFGNNVFFCISGLFLIPAAVAAAKETGNGPDCPGYWRVQARKAARRAAPLLATIAFYVVAVLAMSAFVVPIEDATPENLPGLLGGLEFIWVYLVLMVLTPVIGWAKARLEQKPAAWRAVAAVFVIAVFAVNAYIAFVDQGDVDRGLGDWRKLMSAVTYLAAFVIGGEVSSVRLGRRAAGAFLVATVAASLGVETALAHARELDLMAATSFKSTSALAFCTAVAAVLFARSCTGREREEAPRRPRVQGGEERPRVLYPAVAHDAALARGAVRVARVPLQDSLVHVRPPDRRRHGSEPFAPGLDARDRPGRPPAALPPARLGAVGPVMRSGTAGRGASRLAPREAPRVRALG